jgi:hypothetical protein
MNSHDEIFVFILVCVDPGLCCLSYDEGGVQSRASVFPNTAEKGLSIIPGYPGGITPEPVLVYQPGQHELLF